jgi:FAD/FMN-containing dehydrogenase
VLRKNLSYLDSSRIPRSAYKIIDNSDLNYFKTILPHESILTENLETYNTDWTNKFTGYSTLVLKPKTTEDISAILKYCYFNQLAVVPQSGNTGLVGGSFLVHDEIVISLSKMNIILNFNEISNNLHCEAGCILEELSNYLNSRGYVMPLDLGAKGSCMIGGNLATNAGGIHFVKYGSLRANCKGLKFVLPNGDIINSLKSLPKNNTGYDLKQLLIGSEGTLGIITEFMITTPIKAKFNDLALLAVESFDKVLKVYEKVKYDLSSFL